MTLSAIPPVALAAGLPTALAPEVPLPVDLEDPRLDTPAVLVDLDVVEANLASMAHAARRAGVALRPHAKTHKSLAMAERQLTEGAVGLTVANTTEAEVMSASATDDLLLAYPVVGARKLERLVPLLRQGRLTLVGDSPEVIEAYRRLAEGLGLRIPVLVEVDSGMNRSGALPADAVRLSHVVASAGGLEFRGIMTHAGHAHDADDPDGLAAVARQEASVMGGVRADLEALGIDVPVVSAGSTLTAHHLQAGDGITEIRPGTYIYNDLRTLGRWACAPESLAVTCLATVASANRERVTLDAGSKTLTMTKDATYGFGHLLGRPEAVVERVSEEHGVVMLPAPDPTLRIGDRVRVLPVHVCVWMDLQPEVYGVRGNVVVERIPVDAMRHSL